MNGSGKYILILMYQYSVVLKGIERKLKDAGYFVEVLENFELIPNRAERTDVFLTYLPADIMEDEDKRESLEHVCKLLNDNDCKMITIGESKYRGDLKMAVPELDKYLWLDRPVEMDVLTRAIDETIAAVDVRIEKKRILIVDDDPSYAGMVR